MNSINALLPSGAALRVEGPPPARRDKLARVRRFHEEHAPLALDTGKRSPIAYCVGCQCNVKPTRLGRCTACFSPTVPLPAVPLRERLADLWRGIRASFSPGEPAFRIAHLIGSFAVVGACVALVLRLVGG